MMGRQSIVPLVMAAAAIGLASLFGAVTWSEITQPNPALDSQLRLYDRYRAIAGFEPRLPELEGNRTDKAYNELFMSGGTPAEVSANLTGQLNQITQSYGVQVLRTSDLAPLDRQAITLVGSEFELVGQIAAVYAVIGALETAKPFLVVERFAVRSNGAYQAAGAEEPPVAATLSVYAATRRSQDTTLPVQPP